MRTTRAIPVIAAFVALTSVSFATHVRAEWSTQPVTISSAMPRTVEACPDGAHGVFVSWIDAPYSGTGALRVQHLLQSGEVDVTWPAGGVTLTANAAYGALLTIPDRIGGVYLFWQQGGSLMVSRVDATGSLAPGWPSEGRRLGNGWMHTATIADDGYAGFFAAWIEGGGAVKLTRIGPNGSVAAGWSDTPLTVSPPGFWGFMPQLARAQDGGAFLAYLTSDQASWNDDGMTCEFLLQRWTAGGAIAADWPVGGISFGQFAADWFLFESGSFPVSSLIGLSEDAAGGLFLLIAHPIGFDSWSVMLDRRLYRLQENGATAAGWPAEGRTDSIERVLAKSHFTQHDGSFIVLPDGMNGAWVGSPFYYTDAPPSLEFQRCLPQGNWTLPQLTVHNFVGHERAPRGDGGIYAADFVPTGPSSPYSPYAYLRVVQSSPPAGWTDFYEWHPEVLMTWFGDIGLASMEDGGAVLVWSQARDQVGLFARKFSTYGEVTGVPPPTAPVTALRGIRFEGGAGVRATFSTASVGRIDLFDLAGRRISTLAVGAGDHEITMPGTSAIASGLYFARLTSEGTGLSTKVVVAPSLRP